MACISSNTTQPPPPSTPQLCCLLLNLCPSTDSGRLLGPNSSLNSERQPCLSGRFKRTLRMCFSTERLVILEACKAAGSLRYRVGILTDPPQKASWQCDQTNQNALRRRRRSRGQKLDISSFRFFLLLTGFGRTQITGQET